MKSTVPWWKVQVSYISDHCDCSNGKICIQHAGRYFITMTDTLDAAANMHCQLSCAQGLAKIGVRCALAWQTSIPQTLSWYAGHSDNDTDFITTLTGLFKDIAMAVEENHDMLLGSFGASCLVDFILGLQAECDLQVRHPTSASVTPPGLACQVVALLSGKATGPHATF